jgi:DNA-binding beta-propeller fold protein YncE
VPAGDTVSVIDGAACTAAHPAGCAPVGTVAAGPAPAAAAVDTASDTIYVADTHDGTRTGGPGTVAVVDGSHCNGRDVSGCASQTPRLVIVGSDPEGVAVDAGSHAAYVTNPNDDTVSVIDVPTCNATHPARCQDRPPTLAVDGTPVLPVVDAAHRSLYVVNTVDNDVAVLSDRSCGAHASWGCRHPAPAVRAGSFPNAIAVDERHQTVYAGDTDGGEPPFTIAMIDAGACDASGCSRAARSFQTLGPAFGIAVDQRTDSVYVAGDGPLQLIDAARCNAGTSSGCGRIATVPAGGFAVALDETTETVYTLNRDPDGSGHVTVIDGRHCHAGDSSGCAAQTAAPAVSVGGAPISLALDAAARTLYVTSLADHAVSVVDLRHCHAGDTGGCAGQTPPEVPVPGANGPLAVGVDHATGTAYVTDSFSFNPGVVSMIDTRHCRAGDTSRCTTQTPPTIRTPAGAAGTVRIDPATDAVYIADNNDSSVAVIDGRHCNAADASACRRIGRVQVGSDPSDLALDPGRGLVFVPNFYDDDVSVLAQPPWPGVVFTPPWSS